MGVLYQGSVQAESNAAVPVGPSSDSQHFKSLRRGVLRAFWDLKAENGVFFFGQKSFSDSTFSFFLLIFFQRHFRVARDSIRRKGRKKELQGREEERIRRE
jgi:hypothetical protein